MTKSNVERAPTGCPAVGTVIVAYRSSPFIRECLCSLPFDGPVVVVDNANEDLMRETVDKVAHELGRAIRYVSMDRNVGFARAANLGARLVGDGTDWLVFLNPDTVLGPGAVRVVSAAAELPACIVTGLLHSGDRPASNLRPLASPAFEIARAAVGTRRAERLWSLRQAAKAIASGARQVPQVDGAFMVLAREAFWALEGFDERFELYYEDVDLCRRAGSGGGCWVVPVTAGTHVGGASSSQCGPAIRSVLGVSRVRYLRKWWPRAGSFLAGLCCVVELAARSLGGLSEGSEARIGAARRQWAEILVPQSQQILS